MTTCLSCGNIVTGKKFCASCGAQVPVQAMGAMRTCPACHMQVAGTGMFCTQCGYDMRAAAAQNVANSAFCTSCGRQNDPGVRFCGGCGTQTGSSPSQVGYAQSPSSPYQESPYSQQSSCQQTPYSQPQQQSSYQQAPYSQPQQPSYQQAPYSQPQQPSYQQASYSQPQQQPSYQQTPYSQPQQPSYQQQVPYSQYAAQGGYQPQPMLGQQPMVLRCPVCMAMAPMGSTNCVSCHTSLAGVVPTPANMPMQGQQQQGMGGMLQGNAGKYAMGALGGVAALLGGEMLLNGAENAIADKVEGDMGMSGQGHHHRHHREEGLLGGLGELAQDVGLF